MRKSLRCGTAGLALLLGSHAVAQETSTERAQAQSPPAQQQPAGTSTAPDHTVPAPPHAQPQAPIADQAKPAAVGPAQANTTGSMPRGEQEGPPGATRQTMPSTISAENAAQDKLPITALQLLLTDEQRKLIADAVAATPASSGINLTDLHVSDFLPSGVLIHELPLEVARQVPRARAYKYVKSDDRILLVDPPLRVVVSEIKR